MHRGVVGEKGFSLVRYNGWIVPYTIIGDYHHYTFDGDMRERYIDARDESVLLDTVVDGVKVFDKIEGASAQSRKSEESEFQ